MSTFNNLRYIKTTLKSLLQQEEKSSEQSKHFPYYINPERWFEILKNSNKITISQEIRKLQDYLDSFRKKTKLVQSKFNKYLVPLVYDALYVIYKNSDEKFRQNHFQELKSYFDECSTKKSDSEQVQYENQVKVLIPIVKSDICYELLQKSDTSIHVQELLNDLEVFLKFSRINKEDIFDIVKTKLESNDFNVISFDFVALNSKNGPLGDYFNLNIEVEGNKTKLIFFAKFLNAKTPILKKLLESGPSKKEEFFYMQYLKILKEYGLEKLQDFAPKCYFSRQMDLLVLDNLSDMGFDAVSINANLDYNALSICIKKIARFHSTSLILEEIWSKNSENQVRMIETFRGYVSEVFLVKNKEHMASFEVALETMYYLLDIFPDTHQAFPTPLLKEKMKIGWDLMFERIKESKTFRNTVCHGDMHVANILLKYNHDTCEGIRMIDFQMLRYCPPAHDLLFFIYQNSTKELRDQHFKELTNLYYKELEKQLTAFDVDAKQILSYQQFEDSLKYMKLQAIFHSLYYSPVTLLESKFHEEVFHDERKAMFFLYDNRKLMIDIGLKNDAYKNGLKGLIEDFVKLCEDGEL